MIVLKASRPSQAQLEAGNYPKERRTFAGLPVSIENAAGSKRSGRDRGGKAWSVAMKHDYGYVRGTLGVDGDHFDVYLGPNENAGTAYVVTTMAPPAFERVDEQKAMLGFNSEAEARVAFLAHYDNPKFLGNVTAIPMERFKAELATTREQPRMLKGGPGSGNFDHGGRPGRVGGSAAAPLHPSSDAISDHSGARTYWLSHLGGRIFALTMRTGKGEYKVEVEFAAANAHAYTRGARAGEVPDTYDQPGQKTGGRVFDQERARLMDQLIPTIARPWKVLGQLGADVLIQFGRRSDGGAYTAALNVRGPGRYSFASAYPRSKGDIARLAPANTLAKSEPPPGEGGGGAGLPFAVPTGHGLISRPDPVAIPAANFESGQPEYPFAAARYMDVFTTIFKALAAGERWITVRPNGPGTEGHPLLIKPAGDGSMKVIGGAGGKLNHLRLTGVKSEADYNKEAGERSKAYREQRKRQAETDKRDGLKENKSAAREAVRDQVRGHQAAFVKSVASALGWKDEDIRFPEEKFRNLSPAAQTKAAADHGRAIMQRAREAVDHQRQRLVQDAELRSEADLGEVPLESAKPEQLSVQDIAPVPPTVRGLGFAPAYEARSGMEEGEARKEAEAFKPPPDKPRPEGAPSPVEKRKAVGEAIAKELEGIRDPLPRLDPAAKLDAKASIGLLKAEKLLKAAKKAAVDQNRKIDAAKQPVEPKAYVVEVAGVAPDKTITADLENDLRTLRTRGFLDEVGKEDQDAVGRHIGSGAYNSVNALALAAGGAALLDRSTVDVLGIAGASQVLARRLATDLTPDEFEAVKGAMGRFHTDHYMRLSDKALREARDWHDMANEIELGEAATATDLQAAQELNARRREFIGNAERVLGSAYGEMEANAALTLALEQPKKAELKTSLGSLPLDQAIVRLRAIGLNRGDYQLERVGPSTMLTITGGGMDRLAKPVSREDLARTRTALDIIEGRQDEHDWLPAGVTRRSDAVMAAPPGVAPRLAKPFKVGTGGVDGAVQDYIGGRAADGDSPADIMAGLLSEDTLQRSGDRAGLLRAVGEVCPLYDADGKLVRAEAYADKFAGLADTFVEREHGQALSPIHKQQFEVDQVAVDALHQALAKNPEGAAAFKPIGDLAPQDQAALRGVFAREYGRSDPAADGMRQELEKLGGAEPEREVEDMFGRGPNPAHADWRAKRDELAGKVNAATMTWGKYLEVMGSPANAYRAMQDVVRSKVLHEFADAHNRARPDAALKLGRTVIANDLSHLDALDPVAREKRLADHRQLADSLRNRAAGRYTTGGVSDKLDAAREHEEAFGQSQMGLFGPSDPSDEDDAPTVSQKPLALGERHTIGHAAERQVAAMMPNMGDFRPGQPVQLWQPTMSGKFIGRQRAVKHIRQMKRTVLGLGVGSGKTSISLAAFTDAHAAGDAKRGLFVVPSVVQGQFHGEALTMLEAGKYNWHCNPGADRAERIAAYKNPDLHFNVVTHQAFRDDMLHMAGKRQGTSADAVSEKLDAMKPTERRDYMRDLMQAEGMSHDYLAVDEGHNLLNRAGKENSRMANVIDGVAHGMRTHVSMSADPIKNDPSEAFDILAKMDPERYSDRDAFMRRYGVDTPSARDELRREMARHFYTGAISSGVNAERREMSIKLAPEQVEHMDRLDAAAAKARLARMRGEVDVEALRTLSPNSFKDVDPAQHEAVAKNLNRSIGIIKNGALNRALSGTANTEAISGIAHERRGKMGVVFTHNLQRVAAIEARLKAEGHRVVTLTGGDTSKDKARKLEEYRQGQHDVLIASDAGAVGANMQKGQWLVQDDTPATAMLHAQRQGRINRIGQKNDVDLIDLVPDHPEARRARKRLANKYELRDIMTSPLEGLDDTGLAGYLHRARAGESEAAEPVHATTTHHAAPVDDQASMF